MQSMFLSDLPDSIGLVAGKESPTRARVPVCAWLAALSELPDPFRQPAKPWAVDAIRVGRGDAVKK